MERDMRAIQWILHGEKTCSEWVWKRYIQDTKRPWKTRENFEILRS